MRLRRIIISISDLSDFIINVSTCYFNFLSRYIHCEVIEFRFFLKDVRP